MSPKRLLPHIVQRRRRDVERWMGAETPFPERIAEEVRYTLSSRYARVFIDVLEYCRETAEAGETLGNAQRRVRYWAMIALLRCLLSSPAAAVSVLSGRLERIVSRHEKETGTPSGVTRADWMVPFLGELGWTLHYQRAALTRGGASFTISHLAGESEGATPVHIVAFDRALDERGKDRQRSPHALIQEFLNRDDSLWGLVTNGRKLRLLRNTQRFTKPTYVEFDLEAIVEGNLYSEFLLLYRVLHRSRFPEGAGDAHECLLERWYQQGIEEGGRVRERLRDGVEAALKAFGTGFLAHPDSDELREAVERETLPALEFYRELLRLVYRLLFLMVAEERKLLFLDDLEKRERQEIYTRWYSIERLRARAEARHGDDPYPDLWQGLVQTFRLFREERHAQKLGLGVLDGELFGGPACRFLDRAQIRNDVLLDAIFQLSTFEETVGRKRAGAAGSLSPTSMSKSWARSMRACSTSVPTSRSPLLASTS